MNLKKEEMINKLKRYNTLEMQLKHLNDMLFDLNRGKSLRQLNVFGANITDLVYVPENDDFRERLKEVIILEVKKEIARLEEEKDKIM